MARTVNFEIHVTGFDGVLRDLEKEIDKRAAVFVRRLAEIGLEEARVQYASAPYAGDKGEPGSIISMNVDEEALRFEIVAEHDSVLFVEFGTGVLNFYSAPEAKAELTDASEIVAHGEYGDKRAKSPFGWIYKGEMPEQPPVGTAPLMKEGYIHTYGEPAHPFMYHALKKIQDQVEEVAKEVFGS